MPSKASRRARTASGQRRTLSTIRLTGEAEEEDDECAGAAAAVAVVAVAAPVADDKVADDEVAAAAAADDDDDEAVSDGRDPTVSCATASACPTRYCCTYRLSNVAPECSML